jgi:diaminopimelate epimerase
MGSFPFVKMHGTGNDFVVLDALSNPLPDSFDFPAAAQALCTRRFSVGGDGLLLLDAPDDESTSKGAALRMRMWNPDGSEDMCGNGLRCVARLGHVRGHVASSRFTMQTSAGLRTVSVRENGLVHADMGQPRFDLDAIPMRPPAAWPHARALDYTLEVDGRVLPHVTSLSTGTAHTVIFLDAPVDEATFSGLSPHIEHHAWFPERTSIMWAHVIGQNHIKIRIWERGAGETLACGTGACATAVAAQATGRCTGDVTIESRGGRLQVRWQPGRNIEMIGPAAIVFQGVYSGDF